jgi:hypothetical protein
MDLHGLIPETDQIRVHPPDPYHPRSLLLGEHRFCGFNGLARIAFYNGFNPLSTIKIVNRQSSIVNKKGPAFAEPFSFQ